MKINGHASSVLAHPQLRLCDVTLSLRRDGQNITAVNELSLHIYPGQTLGLVGESGSGKSMTALSIVNLLPRSASPSLNGSILFDNRELLGISEKEMRTLRGNQIGFIFQEPSSCLNPLMSVGRQVREVLITHGKVTSKSLYQQVVSLFQEVGIPEPEERYHAYPHELSGGQQQRVMIAMALACDPILLIADEPTTSLDVTIQAQILKLLTRLQMTRQMSMLFISHDLAVIHAVAHHVAVMQQGTIVEQGDVLKIFSQPTHPYTKALIACRPELGSKRERLATLEHSNADGDGALFTAHRQIKEKKGAIVLKIDTLNVIFNAKRITKKQVHAVKAVTMEVRSGCTMGLVGESGSGKTTVGLAVIGLIKAISGRISLFDRYQHTLTHEQQKEWKRRCVMIFQDSQGAMNPRLRVEAILMEPLRIIGKIDRQEGRHKILSLLAEVGLQPEHLRCYPHQLSGGQRQRVCIARALALDPDFLICDEIVSALDVSVQAQILNLLKDIQQTRNLSMLFISHDLSVVDFMADDIAVMKGGTIVERGATDDVLRSPQQAYTQQLIDAIQLTNLSPYSN